MTSRILLRLQYFVLKLILVTVPYPSHELVNVIARVCCGRTRAHLFSNALNPHISIHNTSFVCIISLHSISRPVLDFARAFDESTGLALAPPMHTSSTPLVRFTEENLLFHIQLNSYMYSNQPPLYEPWVIVRLFMRLDLKVVKS